MFWGPMHIVLGQVTFIFRTGPNLLPGDRRWGGPHRGEWVSTLMSAVEIFLQLILAHIGQTFFPNDITEVSLYHKLNYNYGVAWLFELVLLAALGSPSGGLTIVTSSGGRSPLQTKAFLTSPCLRVQRFSTAVLTRKWRNSDQSTEAYRCGFDQTCSLWLPRTSIWDSARSGKRFSSLLMVRTHIVEIAWGRYFYTWHDICQGKAWWRYPYFQ